MTQTPALRQVLCFCDGRSDVLHLQNREAGAACEFADEQTRHVAHATAKFELWVMQKITPDRFKMIVT